MNDTQEQSVNHRASQAKAIGRHDLTAMAIVSIALIATSAQEAAPLSLTEVLGFVTGGICVWLTVREHIATWPIGIANNVFFFVLFWQSRLFADAGLQIVYVALALYGWWTWLHGGPQATPRQITRTTSNEWLALAALVPLAVWGLQQFLLSVAGAAPFWDALTTVLSLAAQFLMCRKRLEHWLVWIVADIIYIPLYVSRELTLTAVLYFVFLVMCLIGLRDWSRSLRRQSSEATT
jgi:nicotinamide mononucleotide transporter